MSRHALHATPLALLLAFTFPLAQAASITWDEAVDGDLAPELAPFTLGSGVHTFTGTTRAFFPGEPNDLDSFLFNLPAGTSLSSVSFAFGNVQYSPTTLYLIVDFAVSSPDVQAFYTPTQSEFLYFPEGTAAVSPVALFESALPLGPGEYRLLPGIGGADPGLEFSWAYDYTLSFTVVPIPPAVVMFASGLGLLAAYRKRRRTSGQA